MRFLIQKIDHRVKHDFSFTLLESIEFQKWFQNDKNVIASKYIDYYDYKNWCFKPFHQHYVPVGSVEFVTTWFERFCDHTPKPINVPEELFKYCNRIIWNGNENGYIGYEELFVKSNDNIKGFKEFINSSKPLPKGNYQFSEVTDIESEWRAFVYQGKLVGLQNYSGEFTMFPDVEQIEHIIKAYKSAPIAYTLDVGVFDEKTFVVEIHDFFSCGLYGFSDHKILPYMLYRWHHEYMGKHKLYGNKL